MLSLLPKSRAALLKVTLVVDGVDVVCWVISSTIQDTNAGSDVSSVSWPVAVIQLSGMRSAIQAAHATRSEYRRMVVLIMAYFSRS